MNIKKYGLVVLVGALFSMKTVAQTDIRVFGKDKNALITNKQKLKEKKGDLYTAYLALLTKADKLLSKPAYSVMEKKQVPPSKDMHDYMSIAIYYWPDPSKPNGLPYMRKDGEINPEVGDFKDKANMMNFAEDVQILSLAYYFSDDIKYAQKASQNLKTWFIDPATKMNPNLNFAQAIKGLNDGRGIGIIESRILINVVDAIGLIQNSPSWSKVDQKSVETWFSDFLSWLTTSKNGIDEMKTKNNHGIWYDTQKLCFALFTNHTEIAQQTYNSLLGRVEKQMDTTGFFPLELERTIGLHYSAFIIEPLMLVANMADAMHIDYWNYSSTSGKTLKKSTLALIPYLTKEKEWFTQQIKPFEDEEYGAPILAYASYKYDCKNCVDAIYSFNKKNAAESILHLTTLID
jgi:hypothetical protein